MAMPAITRKYTPGSCCNRRKAMKLPPCRETRPDSRALCAEQFRVPNKKRKEP